MSEQRAPQPVADDLTPDQLRATLLPAPTPLDEPFWDGLHEGELRLKHCKSCNAYQYPPETFCYECGSTDMEWQVASGRGTVYSFITVHQRFHAAFADNRPYNVAIIQLEEGPRLVSNVVGIPPHDVQVGMSVKAAPHALTEEQSVLYFEQNG